MAAPLLIFDAPSLLYRAFYALPDSITEPEEKRPVNALLGSTNLVLYEWETHRPRAAVGGFGPAPAPRAVGACSAPDAPPSRTELSPPYHAARPEMPDGLTWQWSQARGFYES